MYGVVSGVAAQARLQGFYRFVWSCRFTWSYGDAAVVVAGSVRRFNVVAAKARV